MSPNVVDDRDQAGGRLDYKLSEKHSMLGRFMWSHTNVATPKVQQPADALAIAKIMDLMVSDTYMFSPNAINQVRFAVNKIDAQPAVTSGLTNDKYGINVKNTNPLAVGLPSHRHLRLPRPRRPPAALRAAQQRCLSAHR